MTDDETYSLRNKWTLWFHHVNDENWDEDSYIKLCEISNLGDYHRMINTLPNVMAGMFFLMKDDIFPRWEDINNIDGGYWSFRVVKPQTNQVWGELTAAAVGHTLTEDPEDMEIINGISVSPKINNCIFKIWNLDSKKKEVKVLDGTIPGIVLNESLYKKHQDQTDFRALPKAVARH